MCKSKYTDKKSNDKSYNKNDRKFLTAAFCCMVWIQQQHIVGQTTKNLTKGIKFIRNIWKFVLGVSGISDSKSYDTFSLQNPKLRPTLKILLEIISNFRYGFYNSWSGVHFWKFKAIQYGEWLLKTFIGIVHKLFSTNLYHSELD